MNKKIIVCIFSFITLFAPLHAGFDVMENTRKHPESAQDVHESAGSEDAYPEIQSIAREALQQLGSTNTEQFPIKHFNKEYYNATGTFGMANLYGMWFHHATVGNLQSSLWDEWNLNQEEREIYRNYIIKHEATHVHQRHSQKKQQAPVSFGCIFLASPLTTIATSVLAKKQFKKTTGVSVGAGLSMGLIQFFSSAVAFNKFMPLQDKLHEMEADLGATHLGVFDKKIVMHPSAQNLDEDDGVHPTPRETRYYAQQFLDAKRAGKNPSYKAYAHKYLWEREVIKPFWQKKIS